MRNSFDWPKGRRKDDVGSIDRIFDFGSDENFTALGNNIDLL